MFLDIHQGKTDSTICADDSSGRTIKENIMRVARQATSGSLASSLELSVSILVVVRPRYSEGSREGLGERVGEVVLCSDCPQGLKRHIGHLEVHSGFLSHLVLCGVWWDACV